MVPTDATKLVWNFTVTGGTGRFQGASGSFKADVQLAAVVGSISPIRMSLGSRGPFPFETRTAVKEIKRTMAIATATPGGGNDNTL